jgi:DMSO/TMAO reductase YedYZ molybdopterin-dependent catalytic subunit
MTDHKEFLISPKALRKKTIIAFAAFFIMIIAAVLSWKWLQRQPEEQGALRPLRKVLNYNESFFGNFFSHNHLAKTFPLNAAVKKVRVNGSEGMSDDFDPSTWKLHLVRSSGDTQLITLEEIKGLPKTEIIFDFKCIEGWSQVTHWGGVTFADFAKKYGLANETSKKYAGLITPDKGYYVGIDMASMLHPQTILCYEMNGKPLPLNNGYPLRLIIPVKYGIKHLKRIGSLFFSNERPPDYWYEQGYDYYSGL